MHDGSYLGATASHSGPASRADRHIKPVIGQLWRAVLRVSGDVSSGDADMNVRTRGQVTRHRVEADLKPRILLVHRAVAGSGPVIG
jgi:hypothetical protein